MAGVNKVILIGNLGKDPEIRSLESGAKVANFPLATTEYYKNKQGERVEQTEWHNINLWNNLADLSEQYLKKGDRIYLEGRIKTRSYDDKDGNKRYITEILGNQMTFLSSPNKNQTNPSDSNDNRVSEPDQPSDPPESDDLPF